MYDIKPNLILGFHGCEASVRDALLQNPTDIKISQEPYDWLGHGMYFWENNYDRAIQWAQDKKHRGAIKEPAVIGAVLYLGHCCDFLETKYIRLVSKYYKIMRARYESFGKQLPENQDLSHDHYKDKLMRYLDCAAIEFLHGETFDHLVGDIQSKGFSNYRLFDTTRGVFTEGGPAFDGSGLFAKSHIQICVRNLNCIQGFFMPKEEMDFLPALTYRE
jgi:hypothetical protein